MKFRSLLYLGIAIVALALEIVLSKLFGGIGCAVAIAGALIMGQGVIMNIYYKSVQHIDIVRFWLEILKMSIAPACVVFISMFLLQFFDTPSWFSLVIGIVVYALVYMSLFYLFSMNKDERFLFTEPIKKVLHVS